MEAVAETGTPVVLCMMAGSDLDLSYAAVHFDAILQLWYPGGQGGNAAAKVLFGEVSPSGKLPVTFYENLEELPEFTDYSMKGRTYRYMEGKAQYPFGFGLTYGKAKVLSAEVTERPEGSGKYCICADIKNEGSADIEEVLQIYVKKTDSPDDTPNPSLCAFERVSLLAGEEKEIQAALPENAFTVIDGEGKRLVEGKQFRFYVGFSQPDERSGELMGEKPLEIDTFLSFT